MSIPATPHTHDPGNVPAQSGTNNLSLPLYGASFGKAFKRFFKKYADFTGRASRSEFWWAELGIFLVSLIPNLMVSIALGAGFAYSNSHKKYYHDMEGNTAVWKPGPLSNGGLLMLAIVGVILLVLFALAIIIPTLSLTWRRLHDANFAGPFFFLAFIPFAGAVILFVFTLLPSKPEGQRFDRV